MFRSPDASLIGSPAGPSRGTNWSLVIKLLLALGVLSILACIGMCTGLIATSPATVPYAWQGTWISDKGRRVVVDGTIVSTVEGSACRDLPANQRDDRLDLCVGTFIVDDADARPKDGEVYIIRRFHTWAPTRKVKCTQGYIKKTGTGLEVVLGQYDEDPMCGLSVHLVEQRQSRAEESKEQREARAEKRKADRAERDAKRKADRAAREAKRKGEHGKHSSKESH